MTRAAEQLFVAQPALGVQIRQLEQDLGVTLLSRHSRGVSPTKAGGILYQWACEILRQVDEAERQVVAAGRQEHESVVLGLTSGVMTLIGRDMVIATRQQMPGVRLSLVEEMSGVLMDALEREEIDIALAYDVHERPGLLRVPLIEEELVFVCAPQRAPKADPVEFADIVGLTLALPGRRDVVRRQLQDTAKRLALAPNVALDVSSISAIKSLVAHDDAVTIMPFATIIDDLEAGRLVGRRIANPTLKRTLYLARSLRRAPIRHEEALIDLLGKMVNQFCEKMGMLVAKLPILDAPLSTGVNQAAHRNEATED